MDLLLIHPSRFWSGPWETDLLGHLFPLYAFVRHHRPAVGVRVLDLEAELGRADSPQEVERFRALAQVALSSVPFDVVGISCFTSYHYLASLAVAEICKALNPSCRVVMGGYHPSACPEDFSFPGSPVDVTVQGEGERALLQVLDAGTGPIPPRLTGTPLDTFDWPLPWEEYPYFRQARRIPLWTSRGCAFRCSFCQDRGSRWRAWTPERAYQEILNVKNALPEVRTINLMDPLFAMQPTWRRALLERLVAAPPALGFWAESRVDLFGPEDAALLGRLDFRLDLGLDAVDPDMVRLMGKAPEPQRYLQAFHTLDQALSTQRVPHNIYLIANHPGETPDQLYKILDFATDYYQQAPARTGRLIVQPYRFYPGSQVAEELANFQQQVGTEIMDPQWWRLPGGDHLQRSAWIVSHRDKAQRGLALRHVDITQAVNHLADAHRDRSAELERGFSALSSRQAPIADPAYFQRRQVSLTPGTHAARREDGRVVLHSFAQGAMHLCSPAESAWLQGGTPGGDPAALFASGFLAFQVPAPSGNDSPSGVETHLQTNLGTMVFRLLPNQAPRSVAVYQHLARHGLMDGVRVQMSCPGLLVTFCPLDPNQPPPFTLAPEPSARPVSCGSLLLDIAQHPLRVAIARGPRPELAGWTVIGELVEGNSVLDGLVRGDVLQRMLLPVR